MMRLGKNVENFRAPYTHTPTPPPTGDLDPWSNLLNNRGSP